MFPLIIGAIKTVFGFIGDKTKAKHERDMAQLTLETRLLLSEQQANSKWEIAQLNDKDKLLRWAAFLLFASPLIAYWISPELGQRVQLGWHSLQSWQSDGLSGMCLAVFGIRKIPELIGSTIGAVKDGLKK